MRLGLDYRPALYGHAGIARAVRELTRALAVPTVAAGPAALELHLYGHGLRRRLRGLPPPPASARLHRWPVPARLLPWLLRLGVGADDLCGRPEVFHWLDYVHPPVRAARTVLTVHDVVFASDPRHHGPAAAGLAARTRRAVRAADRIVVPTRTTADALARAMPDALGDTPVTVIPWGCDHGAATDRDARAPTPPAPRDTPPYLLQVGTIEPRKNHLGLLAAWRALPPERRLPLVVVGAPGWLCDDIVAALEATARATRGDDAPLRWIRHCTDNELDGLLRGCHALVYPSFDEGFGFPPLEAMLRGRPVVASDIAVLREVLGDGAEFADPLDPTAWTAAIDRVCHDAIRRRELARRGAQRAAGFTWARCAAEHLRLYGEAAAGAGRTRRRARGPEPHHVSSTTPAAPGGGAA